MGQQLILTDPKKEDYFYEEAMKLLRTNVQYLGVDVKTILFTSCYENEGKSDVSFQLAKEIGNMGKRVLFVDADIRKSDLLSRYSVEQETFGLSQFLSGQVEAREIIYTTNFQNMDIIFSGPVAPNPSELLEEREFEVLLKVLKKQYDYIIIDSPPIRSVTDAAVVARQCDGVILVVESEMVSYKDAQKAKAQIEKTGCRLLGAVLNKVNMKKDRYYKKYHRYYKKYGAYGKTAE